MFNVVCVKKRIETVKVTYHTVYLDVPLESDIIYITVDDDGSIWGWKKMPEINLEINGWDNENSQGRYLGELAYTGDWKESLVVVSDHMKDQLAKLVSN